MSAVTAPTAAASAWHRIRTYTPPRFLPLIVTLALFATMFGAGSVRYENFGDFQVFLSLLINNAHLVVLAAGMTFVILTGGIDLSVGSVVAMSTMILAKTLAMGWSLPVAMVTVLAIATLLGTVMGLLIHYFDIQPFIATLAGLFLARGVAYLISTESIPITNATFQTLAYEPIALWANYWIRWSVVVALVVVVVSAYVLAFTRFGRTVYAIGGNEGSAMLMGLRVGAVKVGVYSVSGFCAGLGGLLFALNTPSGNSLHAVGMELDAIAAVVIGGVLLTGGRGYVLGALVGVLVLGVIQAFITFDGTLTSWWTRIAIGVLLLAFVVVQRFMTRRTP